jgi:GNAT superfamily N-acetyltransferase
LDITLVEFHKLETDLIQQAISLYQEAFPIEERAPIDYFLSESSALSPDEQPKNHQTHFWVALQDQRVAGLSVYTYFNSYRMGFLFYLATQPELRGRGLGAWLLTKTVELCQEDAALLGTLPALGLVFEVERPGLADNPEEQKIRQRRISFYQRNGAILMDEIDLVTPPISEGLPPVSYHVMFLPVPGTSPVLHRDLKIAFLDVILIHGYGLGKQSKYYLKALESVD